MTDYMIVDVTDKSPVTGNFYWFRWSAQIDCNALNGFAHKIAYEVVPLEQVKFKEK